MSPRGAIQPLRIVWDTKDPHGMGALVLQYFESLRLKAFSQWTIKTRNCAMHKFAVWLEARGITQPREVTQPILESYQRHLIHYRKPNGKALTVAGNHHRMTPIRTFFRWLMKNHLLLSNPAADIELPRADKHLPRQILSPEEAETILQKPDLSKPMGIRDRAILETFYATGIRRTELNNLKIHDVNMNRGAVAIRDGKGRKDRMIPIGDRALAWINKYLLEVRPAMALEPDDGTLFLRLSGIPMGPNRLSDIVTAYVKLGGVKEGSCHLFRHTMATHMLEGGADIRYIQHMLGHSNLETTEVYTRVSMGKLKEVYDLAHPAAKLKKPETAENAPEKLDEKPMTKEELLSILAAEEEEEKEEEETTKKKTKR